MAQQELVTTRASAKDTADPLTGEALQMAAHHGGVLQLHILTETLGDCNYCGWLKGAGVSMGERPKGWAR